MMKNISPGFLLHLLWISLLASNFSAQKQEEHKMVKHGKELKYTSLHPLSQKPTMLKKQVTYIE